MSDGNLCCLKWQGQRRIIVDFNVFVDFCVIESVPAFVAEADISHLCRLRAFVRVYRADRKMQRDGLACARPSHRHPGIFWKLPSQGRSSGAAVELNDLRLVTKLWSSFSSQLHKQTETMMTDP